MKKYIVVITIIALSFSCSTSTQNKQATSTIDIDVVKDEELDLKTITSNINLIPLKLGEEQVLGNIIDICVVEDMIFLLDDATASIFMFDINGNYIKSICNKGSGPNEYVQPTALAFDSQWLYILDTPTSRIIKYDFNLNAIEDIKLNFPSMNFITTSDGFLMRNLMPTEELKSIVHIDYTGGYINSFDIFDKNAEISSLGNLGRIFIKTDDNKILISETYSNDIYEWSGDSAYLAYQLDFGSENQPSDIKKGTNFFDESFAFHTNSFYVSGILVSSFFYNSKRYYNLTSPANMYSESGIVVDNTYNVPFFPQWQMNNKLIGISEYSTIEKYIKATGNNHTFRKDDNVLIFYDIETTNTATN